MRLILDENISLAIKHGLERVGIDVIAVVDWQDRRLRSAEDDDILITAAVERRVLVTFDPKTLRPLAYTWMARGRHHAGVIFIDDRSFRQDDIGGIVRALRTLVTKRGDEDWQDQTAFLQRCIRLTPPPDTKPSQPTIIVRYRAGRMIESAGWQQVSASAHAARLPQARS